MAEAALRFLRRSNQKLCQPSPHTYPGISRHISTRSPCLRKHFSISSRALLPRSRPNPSGYPGFRNESRERRHVREHNLFDPQLQSLDTIDNISHLSDPLEPTRSLTNAPRTLPLARTSTSDLERELLFSASRYPTSTRTRNLLAHILYDRKEKPTAIHYEALFLGNISPKYGSAENVQKLIEEMEQMGISMNINIYTAILRALVVHPDVDILNEIIEACGRNWIEIDLEMRHLICATYVRAGMPEIALEYLEQIEHGTGNPTLGVSKSGLQRGKAELWLYVIFIQQLAEHNDWEGVIRLCYRLCDDTSLGIPLASRHMDVPYAFWNWLLEQSTAAKDKWVTFWIWEHWVLKARLKPAFETCMQVLEICADHGATRVAETASIILRFIWKESHEPNSDHDTGLESKPFPAHHIEKVKTLVARAHDNAPGPSRSSEIEFRRMTAEWWMYDIQDRIGLNPKGKKGLRSLRLDPWSMLREFNDPGDAWARVLSEREDAQQAREDREALRRVNVRRANIDAGRATMLKTLPLQLVADIERAANAELDVEEAGSVSGETPDMASLVASSDIEADESNNASSDSIQPRIRLIDPQRSTPDNKIDRARIARLEELGLDVQVALEMDRLRGERGWFIDDTTEDTTPKEKDKADEHEEKLEADTEDTRTPQRKTRVPAIRLTKLAEISSNLQWYPERSEMLAEQRRFERVMQRKRDNQARRKLHGSGRDEFKSKSAGKLKVRNTSDRDYTARK